MNPLTISIITAVAFTVGLIVTMVSIPPLAIKMRRKGIVGIDIHKPKKPVIPTMCGISILIGLTASVVVCSIILPEYTMTFLVFLSTVIATGFVGIIDDLKDLSPRVKPLLTALAAVPILLFPSTYSSHPVLPIIGKTRLTIVYPVTIPFAIAVPANAVNMMDVLNGSMPGTSSIVVLAIFLSALILKRWDAVVLSICLLGCLLGFYYYNRLPSKVFAGDSGSLAVGAAIGALSIIGHLEIITIIALMPHIMNAFYGLASVGRIYERKEIPERPILILNNGQLAASEDRKAPITLTRTILATGPMKEGDVVKNMFILTSFSGMLAVLTTFLMV